MELIIEDYPYREIHRKVVVHVKYNDEVYLYIDNESEGMKMPSNEASIVAGLTMGDTLELMGNKLYATEMTRGWIGTEGVVKEIIFEPYVLYRERCQRDNL